MKNKLGRPPGQFKGKWPVSIGIKRTRNWQSYASMVQRCTKPNHPCWKYYGGRGITVHPDWLGGNEGFQKFMDHIGDRPENTTLGRINNDGNYEPGNVRWETWAQQVSNRRKGGGPPINPDSLSQKAKRAGLPYIRVYQRIHKQGWSEEKALTTPVAKRGDNSKFDWSAFVPEGYAEKVKGITVSG